MFENKELKMKKILMVENQEFLSDVKIGSHHYAELFAENGYEVLWLSPAFSLLHFWGNKKLFKQRIHLYKNIKTEFKPNILGYAPFTLIPFIKTPPLNTNYIGETYLNTSIPNIKNVLKKLDFLNVDILWISNIKMYSIKNFVNYNKLVHRLADEKTGFKGFYSTLENFENRLIEESDILFATSQLLVDKSKKIRTNETIYLPNGVNYMDFQRDIFEFPSEYEDIKFKKKCVYIGAIAEWLDKDLIEYSLKQLPDIEFIFIGPDHGGLSGLEGFKNLHILGKKSYESLPNYLHYSDLAIIPFKINKLTDAINPVKLFEYLATGTPTLTTNFKEMTFVNGPFEVSATKEEFVSKVKMMTNEKFDKELLQQYAKKNDWRERFKIIIDNIN